MSGCLIDTNVISEFVKPSPDLNVQRWLGSIDPASLFVSVVTLGEIRLGIENLPLSRRRSDLERWLEDDVYPWFYLGTLPVSAAISDRWARLTIQAKRIGITVATADGLIAATALEHNLTIATRDIKDFGGLGIPLINPWDQP